VLGLSRIRWAGIEQIRPAHLRVVAVVSLALLFPVAGRTPKQQEPRGGGGRPMATATAQAHLAMDARGWDEAAYRKEILRGRDLSCRTLFRAVFFDHGDDADPDVLLAAASSDGSLASFSLSSCISSATLTQVRPLLHRPSHPVDGRPTPDLFSVPCAAGRCRTGRSRMHRTGAQRPCLRRQVLPRPAAAAALQVTCCCCFFSLWLCSYFSWR
jgi:hypothetical protein